MMTVTTIAFLVENKPGVLFNVANMFRRRGFNIDSISVGALVEPDLARMTVVVDADARILNQIVEQLSKMVDVVNVKRLDPGRTMMREMLLIKVESSDPMAREEALRHVNTYHGLILNIEAESLIAEVTGAPETIDAFIALMKPIGIMEISRTGVTALEKGRLKL